MVLYILASIGALSLLVILLVVVALVAPRFVPNRERGFASAAAAILVFLELLFCGVLKDRQEKERRGAKKISPYLPF